MNENSVQEKLSLKEANEQEFGVTMTAINDKISREREIQSLRSANSLSRVKLEMKSVEMEEQRDRLKEERQDLLVQVDRQKAEITAFNKKIEDLNQELSSKKETIHEKSEQIEEQNQMILKKSQIIKDLKNEMTKVKEEMDQKVLENLLEKNILENKCPTQQNIIINNKIKKEKDWFSILQEAVFYITIVSISSSFLSVFFYSLGFPKISNLFHYIHRTCTLLIFILKNLPTLLQDPKTFPQKLLAIIFLYFQNELTKNEETLPTHVPTSPSSVSNLSLD